MYTDEDVILAFLKLSRAMRRCAPPHGRPPFPPAVGRLLACIAANRRLSSRDLCEEMDVRPSSLSEILARAEAEGWITRTVDEEDRRVQRIDLAPKGEAFLARMEEERRKDAERKTACLSDEEKAQFCEICNKFSEHMESLSDGLPEMPPMDHPPHGETHRRPRRPFPPEGKLRC